jgi:hypothetical protein
VPDNLPVVLGDQRQSARSRDEFPQRVDKPGHDESVTWISRALFAERLLMKVAYGLTVVRQFFTKVHGLTVETPAASPQSVLARAAALGALIGRR